MLPAHAVWPRLAAAAPLTRLPSRAPLLSHTPASADVNVNNPKEYWDYENLNIDWG